MHAFFAKILSIVFPLTPLASEQGKDVDMVLYLTHILALVLCIGWAIFFIFVLWRFRQAKNPVAQYQGLKNNPAVAIELGVAGFEALLLLCLAIPFWSTYMTHVPHLQDPVEIRVVAQQFFWSIHYPGPDGEFGKSGIHFYNAQTNPLGLDPHDPHGKDDFITVNNMHVPVDRPVVVHLSSKDVIHSFTLPAMRVKRDAIPGMSVSFWFTPIKTGKFDIACSQLCGVGHYRMKGTLTVESEANFEQWIKTQGGQDYGSS